MKWFAPKILKSEYDKVVADNMELELEIKDLRIDIDNTQAIMKPAPIIIINPQI